MLPTIIDITQDIDKLDTVHSWAVAAAMAVASYMSAKDASDQRSRDNAANVASTAAGRAWQTKENITKQGWAKDNALLSTTLSKEQMNYEIQKRQLNYDAWTSKFGDAQDNITDYYLNMSKETVAGEAYNNLQYEYSNAMRSLQDNLAKRNIKPIDGLYNAAELTLDINKANESARILQDSEQKVMEMKNGFLQDQANNPYLDGTRPISLNDSIINSTGANQKDLYKILGEQYKKGDITIEQFKDYMGTAGGSQGTQYYDIMGVNTADYKENSEVVIAKEKADKLAADKAKLAGMIKSGNFDYSAFDVGSKNIVSGTYASGEEDRNVAMDNAYSIASALDIDEDWVTDNISAAKTYASLHMASDKGAGGTGMGSGLGIDASSGGTQDGW